MIELEQFHAYRNAYQSLKDAQGEFSLFALVQPQDSLLDRWDLLVAGDWLKNDLPSYEIIHAGLRSTVSARELSGLSRVVVITDGPELRNFLREVEGREGIVNMHDGSFGGTPLKWAYVIKAAVPKRSKKSRKPTTQRLRSSRSSSRVS